MNYLSLSDNVLEHMQVTYGSPGARFPPAVAGRASQSQSQTVDFMRLADVLPATTYRSSGPTRWRRHATVERGARSMTRRLSPVISCSRLSRTLDLAQYFPAGGQRESASTTAEETVIDAVR